MTTKRETLESILAVDEEPRLVDGYSKYWVTNKGRVISTNFSGARILKPTIDRKGYRRVSLWENGMVKNVKIARLVANAFLQPSRSKYVLHIDGSRKNDVPSNLKWGTAKDNAADSINHGTFQRGERHWRSELTDATVREIRQLRMVTGLSFRKLGRRFGVSDTTIRRVVSGKHWKHV